jgi:hypothetical protein
MKSDVITIHGTGFKQEYPGWKFKKQIERLGRKTLLKALEKTEANL